MLEKDLPQSSPSENIESLVRTHIDQLGSFESSEREHSKKVLVNLIFSYTLPEVEKEWSDTVSAGYTVGKLLEATSTYDVNEKDDLSTIRRRINSMEVLKDQYEILLDRKPEIAEVVVDSMIEKLKSNRPENMIFFHHPFDITHYKDLQDDGNYTLLEFFGKISDFAIENRSISEKAFEALIQTWGIGDFSAPDIKGKIIKNFFRRTLGDKNLSKDFVNIYFKNTEDIKGLNSKYPYLLSSIYNLDRFLLSDGPWKGVPDRIKKETRREIFDRSITILEKERNPQIREIQIKTLATIVEIEDKESNTREKKPFIYTPKIFSTYANIMSNEILQTVLKIKGGNLDEDTLSYYKGVYDSLSAIFTKLYQRNLSWEEFFLQNEKEVLSTFINYVDLIVVKNTPLSKDTDISNKFFKTLESILPVTELQLRGEFIMKDPFLKEVAEIKSKLYSGDL